MPAHADLFAFVLDALAASDVHRVDEVQSLWSGYGQVLRLHLKGGRHPTVVVKRVTWPTTASHPKGWSTTRSHERKVQSFAVEAHFYAHQGQQQDASWRMPRLLAHSVVDDGVVLVLEDLDAAGFAGRRKTASDDDRVACLRWLAAFHAAHMSVVPDAPDVDGLWHVGTYWHLDTRPDEWDALDVDELKVAASSFDAQLRTCRFQTLVHGDAKLANFCFSLSPSSDAQVAAVDFQYVGGGCGMRDVVGFISSCLDAEGCERQAAGLVDVYFDALSAELRRQGRGAIVDAVVDEWSRLYAVAWADFYRFLAGWSPGHWKMHSYSRGQTDKALAAWQRSAASDGEAHPTLVEVGLTSDDLQRLRARAADIVVDVGRMVRGRRPTQVRHKSDMPSLASQVVTEVDVEAERLLLRRLRGLLASNVAGVLTEERVDDGSRFTRPLFWCVDPLDGTLSYVEGGDGYAVSVALVARDGHPVLGAVHLPADDVVVAAADGCGVVGDLSTSSLAASSSTSLRVYADRSWPEQPQADDVMEALRTAATSLGLDGVDVHVGAGAVVNACRTWTAQPSIYVKRPKTTPGGGSVWDFAATACIARERKAWVSDAAGRPLQLNPTSTTFMHKHGVLYASSSTVAKAVLSHLAALRD